ncbi:hypothetical protein QUF80_20080 [Desulfococcaceae bacterium HSG8]|nr:hypothetical protein [Desulfococcaceae bacterium HSG8]
MKITIILAVLAMMFLAAWADAREIGWIEDFSLAEDRSEFLEQLIPGTEDYYYYHCLHAQHTGDFEQVRKMLSLWIKRYDYTRQVREILNRQALLEYEQNPSKSLEYIREELGLRFHHRKDVESRKTGYPSALDPKVISIPHLLERAFSRYQNLEGIENPGLDILPHNKLNPDRRRDMLKRLKLPDIPGLPKLVVADLRHKHSRDFGAHPIHRRLLKSQLDECLRLMPELMENSAFITAYLSKLSPDNDINIRYDLSEKKAYLDRLWAYAKQLSPAHNSLKVHIFYQILDLNREQGNYDPDLFMTYIQLPRVVHYANPDYLSRKEIRHVTANLSADFSAATRLPSVGRDEELVRDYLSRFFLKAKNYKPYVKFIKDTYLKDIFAETKIVNNIGDMEQWYSMISPNQYQFIRDRVDLEFARTNEKFFATDAPVALDLYIKNIKTLIVKVFELNTFNYYQTHLSEVDTAVNLDGLTATWEEVITYDTPPLHRIRRSFEFPQVNKPGVFVAEFIGNGKSSRAVIRKGKLYCLDTIGPAGHEFTVRDEKNQKCPEAVIRMAGQEYSPDDEGVIIIPFSNSPGPQTIILKDKDFCSLASFNHLSENYSLKAGFYADRESLLKGFNAKVLVRPVLSLNRHPISLSLLENITLIIESVDRSGVSSVKEVPDFKVFEDRESVYEFQVPDGLANLRFTLKAQVRNMSRNKKDDLSDHAEFPLNGINSTLITEDMFLSHADNGYILELLGKNGEPKPGSALRFELKHRYFRETIHVNLQTDSKGQVQLGQLDGIQWIRGIAAGPREFSHRWYLSRDSYRYPGNINEEAGGVIRLPYMESGEREPRLCYALFEKRGQTYTADYSHAIQVNKGFLEISELPPGDYDLFLKQSNTKINLCLTQGSASSPTRAEDSFVISENRALEVKNEYPLQITDTEVGETSVKVRLGNASEFTRVHVLGTRFMPSFHIFSSLVYTGLPEPYQTRLTRAESQYVAGRNIGDEYRYILDRKYAEKFPGNMLNRPELLLNPWSIRKTETATDEAKPDEVFASMALAEDAEKTAGQAPGKSKKVAERFSDFDFLARASVLLVNLKPDENGVVTIDRSQIGDYQQLHLIAVDPFNTAYREISLPKTGVETRDLRLIRGLDTEKHFTEQKQISFINTGETFRLEDMTTSDFAVYDSVDRVYQLLMTLSENKTLQEFGFILRWSDMNEEEKQEKYSEYACHELNFFIYHKDREFFDRAVLPYLRNKKDKTFMDHWLLGDDLTRYLEPWAYSRLNIVEKILMARRGPGDKYQTARYVRDLADMIPPDIDKYNRLFDTALKGRALEEDSFGFADAKEKAVREEARGLVRGISRGFVRGISRGSSRGIYRGSSRGRGEDMDMDGSLQLEEEVPAAPSASVMEALAADEMKAAGSGDISGKRRFRKPPRKKAREKARQFFRKLDKTEEWVENNYYKLPIKKQDADLITVNAFWNDYADSDPRAPFFSTNFPYTSRNFAEMMLALAVIDLPFKAGEHKSEVQGITFSLTPVSPMIVFHKEIRESRPSEEKISILAGQNFFRSDDRYLHVDNERFDKFVDNEFLVRTPYGCQVVLSNPSSSRQKLRLLLQIPSGAMPLNNGFYTRGIPITLEPYATQTVEYHFYFPETGKFGHYPAQIARNEEFIAAAPASELNVVEALSRTDTESWEYVSQNGTGEEILEFLRTHNLNRLDLDRIAFRVKDKAFFETVISLLRDRHTYQHTLWSYGIFHNEKEMIAEYLRHTEYADRCGYYIESPLLTLDPVERKTYQHMEYKPLVNARAHQLGKRQKILNDRFYEQYHRFLEYLSYRPSLTGDDLMAVTYYLLLQDRVSEAVGFFGRINGDNVRTSMQYDYLRAYFDFYTAAPGDARRIAEKYRDYPVPRWRNMFRYIADQLDELEGKTPDVIDKESRDQVQTKLAATAAGFDFTVESRQVTIRYQNLESCQVNYYPMDIELLFSRNPFVRQQTDDFSLIRPNEMTEITLPADQSSVIFGLPGKFHNSNLMVEISAQGMKKSQAYYANSLDIQVIENYGHIRVTHQETHASLPKVYVKVYARMKGGELQFYKDGYTDLRGRFDYVSLNTNTLDYVEKFAVMVLSEEYGAVIQEASPPKR